jgi:O-antigen/teichoic acid export membrane protein
VHETTDLEQTPRTSSFAADSLAIGMVVMLALTIVQRGLGFFRGIWFCRLLDDHLVGQWAMAFGFVTMITPIMLLGMPGSLPRYVEHFRLRGQLSQLVRRLLGATIGCGAAFFAAMLLAPQWFGWLIFLEPQNVTLIYSVGVAVASIVAFYFVHELVAALRQIRVASLMQFTQSVGFTIIGVSWLSTGGGLSGLVLSFALATTIGILPGAYALAVGWQGLEQSAEPFEATSMWRRLLPYAAALWAMNLLTNVFELSDRYMILHFTPGGELAGQAAVGQYHSGRIIPVLLMSLATMISGVLLPYLSADWEAGRKQAVKDFLRRVLLAMSVCFTLGAAVAMLLAPRLFSALLQDRYNAGLALMPMAFVFCIWSALATVAQCYLFVHERGKLVALAIGAGLIANLSLNALLLPIWGLHGAVVATLCSHGVVLIGIWLGLAGSDYGLDSTTFTISILPATLLAGPWIAIACVATALAASRQAKQWVGEAIELVSSKRQAAAA